MARVKVSPEVSETVRREAPSMPQADSSSWSALKAEQLSRYRVDRSCSQSSSPTAPSGSGCPSSDHRVISSVSVVVS